MNTFSNNKTVIYTLESISAVASDFLEYIKGKSNLGATVIALSGDLGSGKTTFSKEIAKLLDIQETVISPTFVIQKKYTTTNSVFTQFVHIDTYRIENDSEAKSLKLTEVFNTPKTLVFIEWPEKIHSNLPPNTIWVSFEVISQEERKISLKGVI